MAAHKKEIEVNKNDPRVKETIKHIRLLSRRHSQGIGINDYLEYRSKNAPNLPSLNTIYRLFGSWPELLIQAGVSDEGDRELSRTSDEELIKALQTASKKLKVTVLSSHLYDEYRREKDPSLPSSSVIRKWLGPWAEAVRRAGLETTERSSPKKASRIEIIEAIRKAKAQIPGLLTAAKYSDFLRALPPEEKEDYPDLAQVLSNLPTWDAVLKAADVEQSDALHPDGLWTAEEARRIYHQAETVAGSPLTETKYKKMIKSSSKQLPSWQVLTDLLKI
jgi:hypothetical protein